MSGALPIRLDDVWARYPGASEGDAVAGVTLEVGAAELCAVLGPNGAGKSTLVRLLSGALTPRRGGVFLEGQEAARLERRAIARKVAVVHQAASVAFGFAVREVVMMGRAPHQGAWMSASAEDDEAVDRALEVCELTELSGRSVRELSGGEQQRVAIARALAQRTPILVLDEAGAHLDVRHTVALYELIRRELTERRLAVVAVMHDLNVAAQYADRVALLAAGRLVAHGPVAEVMTYRRLKEVFCAELYVGINELDQSRYFLPVRPRTGGPETPPAGAGPSGSRPSEPRDL